MSKYELRIVEKSQTPKPEKPVMEVWLEPDGIGNIDLRSKVGGGPPYFEATIKPNGELVFPGNGNLRVVDADE